MSRLTSAFLASVALLGSSAALAHDGHALFGAHWHATDVLGFVAAGVAVAAAVWFGSK
ncbi:MAG: hypothetical protein RLZZ555_1303 [Pseudomonadota bacterium]|jgi:hypothetical protein